MPCETAARHWALEAEDVDEPLCVCPHCCSTCACAGPRPEPPQVERYDVWDPPHKDPSCVDPGSVGELDGETCPQCGAPHAWQGRDEKQRVCDECRYGE
jgi:hypothetical protein